jgi:signal transduction histidine kinase/DNA-binding response OmpR family regulator
MSSVRDSLVQIPKAVALKWQEIVNLLAEVVNVPAALIMKVEPPTINVFVRSESPGNPYYPEEKACLDTGLYCETVMSSRDLLLVPDALTDQDWRTNPDAMQLGMISYLGLPIAWPDGEIFGTICVLDNKRNEYNTLYQGLLRQFRDVVQGDLSLLVELEARRRTEEELRLAKEAAEAANRAKDEFMANVSHEIRTPMNAILGMTDLVLDTPLTEDQRRNLKTVKAAADNLLGMIDDLLDFSKIEAGRLELVSEDLSLRDALADVLRVLAVRAHKKGLELISHIKPDVPDALIGDTGRLRQVLLNLVGNAIKFTEQGEIVVTLGNQETVATDSALLRFSVKDTGIGISPDKQEKIFRAFEQEDNSTTRKYGGTGLGLTISARLVDLMGGTISVESQPGRGSTFTFTARLARQQHPADAGGVAPPPTLRNMPVLVVDDNATNRHILAEWLRGWKMEPAEAGDGMAAMDALWRGVAEGTPYPLALLDARMPDTDGFAVAAMIRNRDRLAATRIVMLTSGDRPGDAAKIHKLRIDAHLLKPVRQEELLDSIFRVMSSRTSSEPASLSPVPAFATTPARLGNGASLHILVAEDNELSAQLLEQLLLRAGHRVRLVSNGRDALAMAQAEHFDLALLDVQMPELDGLEVVQAIRRREQGGPGHLPVIALTARSRREDRERCLAAGMDEFLTKPVAPADLLAVVGRVLRSRVPIVESPSTLAND